MFFNRIKNKLLSFSNSELLDKYNKSRSVSDCGYFCYAPFKNMYFNIYGYAAPCWLSFSRNDSWPQKSISKIWKGQCFEEIRNGIKKSDLSGKCDVCRQNFSKGNFLSVLARAYDNEFPLTLYPSVMELELGNTCNLQCIMCNESLSSSYAKGRMQKDVVKSPYDDRFAEQIDEFLPHLKEIRFNGGEPFLNDVNFKIWERLSQLNSTAKIVIATNGTVLNQKVKSVLDKNRFHINLSIDSLRKETYESIRVNGNFEEVMSNFNFFLDYCNRKKTTLCILTNPMPQNWEEMPEFIKFCNFHNIPIWFNTIQTPAECALWALSFEKLKAIHTKLSSYKFVANPFKNQTFHNAKVYHNLVHNQIKNWMHEAMEREKKRSTK
jgi:molybdenum cofactor biosynthesis enzyme MoaA